MAKLERIDKILSHHGFGSRKDVKKLLRAEKVSVDGKFVYDSAFLLDVEKSHVEVSGVAVRLVRDVYLMMNKCAGVVCASRDSVNRTVIDLVGEEMRHPFLGGELHAVGRLDIDTEGLLILTTDGSLTHTLLSPKTHVSKTYAVRLLENVDEKKREEYARLLLRGIHVPREGNEAEFDALPAKISFDVLSAGECARGYDCLLTVYEGKFHQVKRMFKALHNSVVKLKRVKIGSLFLDSSLPLGAWRELSDSELSLLLDEK